MSNEDITKTSYLAFPQWLTLISIADGVALGNGTLVMIILFLVMTGIFIYGNETFDYFIFKKKSACMRYMLLVYFITALIASLIFRFTGFGWVIYIFIFVGFIEMIYFFACQRKEIKILFPDK